MLPGANDSKELVCGKTHANDEPVVLCIVELSGEKLTEVLMVLTLQLDKSLAGALPIA
jgi:hypothetical protein